MQPGEWQPFEYANPPADGVYWLVINQPEYEAHECYDGQVADAATGRTVTTVCLAEVIVQGDGSIDFEPVDRRAFGDVPGDAWASHYADVVKPPLPARDAIEQDGPLPDEPKPCRMCDPSVGYVCENHAG